MASNRQTNHIGNMVTYGQYIRDQISNSSFPGADINNILLEDGFNLLQEDGLSVFLLE